MYLYGRATEGEPGRDVSFMFCNGAEGSKATVIDRIDWNPLTAHANRNKGPQDLRLLIVSGNHRHSYDDNLASTGDLRAGNLPVARPIDERLETFDKLVAFVAVSYNIKGAERIMPPLWIEDLFG